jgi:outer membrane protein OmpA-like peptidoglycan-associated protein
VPCFPRGPALASLTVLGEDAILVETAFERLVVRVRRLGIPLTAEEVRLARLAALELRRGLEEGVPRLVAAAQRLAELRFAPGRVRLREPAPSLLFRTAARDLAGKLERELLLGRLVVEREARISLGEREFVIPDLPPPPPAAREAGDQSFEMRFVDEIGQAISSIPTEFAVGGAFEPVTTNAAGIALLEGLKASSATVTVPEPQDLADALEPRWTKPRKGKPPKEANTSEVVFEGGDIGTFPVKAAVPNTLVVKPPPGQLFVELFDKAGRVRHVETRYSISGPQDFEGTTDENGRLQHENVFPGDYTLTLEVEPFARESEAGDADADAASADAEPVIDTYESPLVVQPAGSGIPQLRMLGIVPRVVLARVRGFLFETNKSFLLPSALKSMQRLQEIYFDNTPSDLLLVGHTDTTAEPSINDPLSVERAKNTKAYLEDDVETWLAMYGQGVKQVHRWGTREDRLMLRSMPGFKQRDLDEDLVIWFQRTRGLDQDGKIGEKTRRQLITEYMALDGVNLKDEPALDIVITTHGAGENFPLDASGEKLDEAPADEKEDLIDRRVELYFFDREFGIAPTPGAPDGPEYEVWRARAAEEFDFDVGSTSLSLELVEFEDVLFQTNSAVPLPRPCTADGTPVDPKEPSAVQDLAAALHFAFCYPERKIVVAGHADTTADAAVNDPLSDKRAATVVALLVGDRDKFRNTCDEQNVSSDQRRILEWAAACFDFNCDPKAHGGDLVAATRAFQTDYNDTGRGGNPDAEPLSADGDFGPLTWGAVFDLYELRLTQVLKGDRELLKEYRKFVTFVDPERPGVGFGERYPIEEKKRDNFRSAANRRVEILFFDRDEEPDLDMPLDLSDIYMPGFYERKNLPVDPAELEIGVVKVARLPTRFSNGRTFPKPSCLPMLREVVRLVDETHAHLVIVGHTDRTEKDDPNEQLSLARGQAVAALLAQDKGYFLQRFNEPDPIKEWNWEEVQWMLSELRIGDERCYVGLVDDFPGALTRKALGSFQLDSGSLEVDYGCDAETLEKLVEAYFARLEAPPVPLERMQVVAAGSWHPPRTFGGTATKIELGDELSGVNRRVEIFLFERPVLPDPARVEPATRAESVEYPAWCRATELEIPAPPPTFPIRAFDAKLVPIGGTALSLERHDPETNALVPAGSLSTTRFGSAEFAGTPGSYRLSFTAQGRQFFFALSVHTDEVGGFAAIIPHGLVQPTPSTRS